MMSHQATRRRESSCSDLRTPKPRSRATTAAGELRESPNPREYVASETENTGYALQEIGDTSLDNARITMRTRVAVRDNTPHRFQVVPLRDVGRISCHSFNSTENRLPSCAISVTPKKGSNRNFSTTSSLGWRHKSDLTPSNVTPPRQTRKDTSFCGSTVAENHTSTLSTDTKRMDSVRSCTFRSASDKGMTLTEWDVNGVHSRKPTQNLGAAGHTPSPLSIDSIHELMHSESPLTQTISRSLRHRATSVNVINQSKSSSLNDMVSFNSQQAKISSDGNTANAQRLSHGRSLCHDSDDKSYYSLLDAYETSESTPAVPSTKRHAIYTPSVYIPHFDRRMKSDDNVGPSPETDPFSLELSGDQKPMHESAGGPSSDEDPDTTIRPEMVQEGLATTNDLSMSDSFPGLKQKSSSRSLPLCVPRGLNHSKPLHSVKYIGTADGSRPGAMVYPRIVLSLFAELDDAIDEWKR
ncbi:hypothetical protein D9619_000861 [Psilocybe cf. subviscida]|uniref:Uncharacterized protein n=1 Tax=Psilocybe cf. subviscida TaxID=2480587 RepID=A0A8H5BG19_9AGAR|nr:hypothetical protein D9619_000861 [Psilocybe cf. subviscida]